MSFTFELDLDNVSLNQHAKYLGQRWVGSHTHTHTRTHTHATDTRTLLFPLWCGLSSKFSDHLFL